MLCNATPITIAESLVDLKETFKTKKRKGYNGRSEGERPTQARYDDAQKTPKKWNMRDFSGTSKPVKCFSCDGTHWIMERLKMAWKLKS